MINYFINAPGIDNKLKMKNSGVNKYFLADHLGSTVGLANSSGSLTASTGYDSFGNATNRGFPTRYQFTGREFDETTGLHYYRARWYDAKIGRFISEDPIGFAGGDVNLYGYVKNNPQNWVDPSGNHPALAVAWAIIEVGATGYDVYDFGSSMFDPCSDWLDVGLSGGGLLMGMALPGGGYGKALRITRKGVDRVESHLSKIPDALSEPDNIIMLERLRAGKTSPQDLNFYQHELKESAIMNRKYPNGYQDYDSLRNAHLETLEWQGIPYKPGYDSMLYHPDAINSRYKR